MNITHPIINMKNPIVLFLLLLLFVSSAISEISDKTREEIEHLILRVKQSECIFNRNGTDYQGSEAVTHIITKYEYYNKEIKVTEDFIRYAATKSEFSGRKYSVTCRAQVTINLGDWLQNTLVEFRQ